MPNKYMHEFTVPSFIDNTHHVIGLNGTANEKIPMAMLTELLAANILTARYQVKFVDLLGNNATAITGRQDKAYSTLAQAMAAAAAGETIIVFSCNEGAEVVLKDGVNIFFIGGKDLCNVVGLRDDGNSIGCTISGEFTSDSWIHLTGAGTLVVASGFNLASTNKAICLAGSAKLKLINPSIQCLDSGPTQSPVFIGDGCYLTIVNGAIRSDATNHRAIDLNSTGHLYIKDSILTSEHTESIDASAANNVYVFGTLTSNKNKNSNITIKIGNFVVDASTFFI